MDPFSAYFLWKLVRKNSLWARFFYSALNHWEAIDYESIDNNLSKAFDPMKKFDLKVILRPSKLRCIDLRSRYFPIFPDMIVYYRKIYSAVSLDLRLGAFTIGNPTVQSYRKISRSQIDASKFRWSQYHLEIEFFLQIKSIRKFIVYTFNINCLTVFSWQLN